MLQETAERARARRGASASIMPGLIAVALLGAAITVGILNRSDPPQEQPLPAEQRPLPFSDLPPDVPPARRSREAKAAQVASADLADTQLWLEATAIAQEGEDYFQATRAAKAAGDHGKAKTKGRLAREKFNQAVEMTALWEEELLEQYGDRDPQVRDIKRKRTRWFARLDWLLKSVAR